MADEKTEEEFQTERYLSDQVDNTEGDSGPKFPDVHVQLTGNDGNAFLMIGRTASALRRAGYTDEAAEFEREAFDSKSYGDVLNLIEETVEVW